MDQGYTKEMGKGDLIFHAMVKKKKKKNLYEVNLKFTKKIFETGIKIHY